MRPPPVAVGVRAVLAGAYLARHIATGWATLTHAVALDAEGWEIGDKTLCGRIKTERLCDEIERGAPTCATCAARALRVPLKIRLDWHFICGKCEHEWRGPGDGHCPRCGNLYE